MLRLPSSCPTEGVGIIHLFEMTQQQKFPWIDPWKDIEPHRTTSAVLVILNMRDCCALWQAKESLIQWARAYAHESDREDVSLGSGDTRNILTQLLIFDLFEESC